MKRNQTIQVFSGIDTKKDETIVGLDKLRDISNFDVDSVLGSLSLVNGTDHKFTVYGTYKIKGAFFFNCIAHEDDANADADGYRHFFIVCYAEPDVDNITKFDADYVRVFDIKDNPEILELRNAYNTNYNDFFTSQLGGLIVSDRYDFVATNDQCIINNRNNVPFKFSLDAEDINHTNYKFSFLTLPPMFQIPADKLLNYSQILPSQIGELEGGEYWYKYSYKNSTDDLESQLSEITKINNKLLDFNVITIPNILNPDDVIGKFIINNVDVDNKIKRIKFYDLYLKQYVTGPFNDIINLTNFKLLIEIIYKTNDWATFCSTQNIAYKTGDIGIKFFSNYDKTYAGNITDLEGYVIIQNNTSISEINKVKKKNITFFSKGYNNSERFISDLEILIKTSDLEQESFSTIIPMTEIADTTSPTKILSSNLKGKLNTTKTTTFPLIDGIDYNSEYDASDFLPDDDEYTNYHIKRFSTNEIKNIASNTFYSITLFSGEKFNSTPAYDENMQILLSELNIKIPFNKTLKEAYKIDKVLVYRTNLAGGEPTAVYYLDAELDILFNPTTKEWDTDLEYRSYKNDLDNAYNSLPFNEEYIVVSELNQMLFHNNKLFVVDKKLGIIRFSELITTGLQYFKETSYIFFSQNDGGKITALAAYKDNLIVFLQNKVFTVFGVSYEDNQWRIDSQSIGDDNNGCIAEYSVCPTQAGIIYLSIDGFKRTDSYNIYPLDAEKKYEKYFKRINQNKLNIIQSWYDDGKYYCAMPLDDSEVNNYIMVYNIFTNQFVFYEGFDIDYIIKRQAAISDIYFVSNRCLFNKDRDYINLHLGDALSPKYCPISQIKNFGGGIGKSLLYDRHYFSEVNNGNTGGIHVIGTDYHLIRIYHINELNGYYLVLFQNNVFYSIHKILSNDLKNITIDGYFPGYILNPNTYIQPTYANGFTYKIIKPITARIETGAYMFGTPEYSKSMSSIEMFYKCADGFGELTIYYSLDGGAYQTLCSTSLGSIGAFGTTSGAGAGQGGYFDSGEGKTDYYDRIGKIPFRKIQRFDSIRFKIEYTGIDNFEIRKLLYIFNIHKQRINRFRFQESV